MQKSLFKIGLVFGIICLFIGTSVLPCIGKNVIRDTEKIGDISSEEQDNSANFGNSGGWGESKKYNINNINSEVVFESSNISIDNDDSNLKTSKVIGGKKTIYNVNKSNDVFKDFSLKEKIDLNFSLDNVAPKQVVIGFHKNISYSDITQVIKKYGGKIIDRNDILNFIVVEIEDNYIKKYMEDIAKEEIIRYVEPNFIFNTYYTPSDYYYENHPPYYSGYQWSPQRIGSEKAWDITKGDDNIVIAIVDTGVDYTHTELNNNMWTNPGEIPNNDIDDDGNGYIDDYYGIDFDPPWPWSYDGDPMDEDGHGTSCAGIAAAEMDNMNDFYDFYQGIPLPGGVVGIAQVKIMAVKSTVAWFGLSSNVADGITYATQEGADIISMSIGIGGYITQPVEDACDYAWNNGLLLVAAAGNDDSLGIAFPASYDKVIAVGATDENNQRCSYPDWGSNYGPELDIMAPVGSSIFTIKFGDETHGYFGGTSAACPQVAGAAALIWSYKPSLTNQQVKQLLLNSATDLSTTGWDQFTGYGLLNVGRAITSDLIVQDIWTEPDSPVGGQSCNINARIYNQGLGDTVDNFKVKLYIDDDYWWTWTISPLNSQTYIDIGNSFTLPEGIHIIKFIVDEDLGIPEYDEFNNDLIISKSWSGPTSITITETLNPINVYPRDSVQVYGTAIYNSNDPVINTDVEIKIIQTQDTWVTTTDYSGFYSKYITAPDTSNSYTVKVTIIDGQLSGTNSKTLNVLNPSQGSNYELESTTTCKDVEDDEPYDPIDETEVFRTTDEKSVTWIYLTDIYESLNVEWKFYDPNNNLYDVETATIPDPGSGSYWSWWKVWAWIWIDDHYPEDMEGAWTCKIYIDEGSGYEHITTEYFTIRYEVTERTMCKNVGPYPSYDPIDITNSFKNTDTGAYAWIGLINVAESLAIEWRWYDPNNNLYKNIPYTIPDPSTEEHPYWDWYHYWSWIGIYGNPPQSMCGQWRVDSYIKDVYGSWDLEYSQYFTITDNTPPGQPGTPSDGGIYSTSNTITWSWTPASEDDIINLYELQVGTYPGGNDIYSEYLGNTLSKQLSGLSDGITYYAKVRAMNGVGQWGPWSGNSDGITVDTLPPITSISLSGTQGENGYYLSSVTVSLSASDSTSGVSLIKYKVDSKPWQTYTASFIISSEGNHTVEYFSQDNAGNVEISKQEQLTIHGTAVYNLWHEDFETGYDGWYHTDGDLSEFGTQSSNVFEGNYSFIMTGVYNGSGYSGRFTYDLNVSISSDTTFSFAYAFPEKNCWYIGYLLTFNTGKIGYYISLFYGDFINTSVVYLLQYNNEDINSWYSHTANIYDNYESAFGSVPSNLMLTSISMIMGQPGPQTAFFDAINLSGISPFMDEWPMSRHDAAHSGYSHSSGPSTNNILWTYTTGGVVCSSPAVVNKRVFIGSEDHNIYCLDAETGAKLWNYTTGDIVYSSPAVVNGRVYVGSLDHKMYCLDAETGGKIWDYTTGDIIHGSSPTVTDNKVFIGSYDHSIYCLDAQTGDKLWNYQTNDRIGSTAAVVDGKVYTATYSGGANDDKILCLNAENGSKIWEYTTGGIIYSSPLVYNGMVYFGSYDYKIYCLNAETGIEVWEYTTGYIVYSSPAILGNRIYIGSSDNNVYCLDAMTGSKIWEYTTGGFVESSPAVVDGMIYIGSKDDTLYCLDAATGSKIWEYQTGGDLICSPSVADGNVYIGSVDGTVYCFGSQQNLPPVFGAPSPANGTTNRPLNFNWSIPIKDLDGDTFDFTIYCSNGQTKTKTGATNGTKSLALSGLAYSTTYKVWVNATDTLGNGLYTREWYTFATQSATNHPPNLPKKPTGPVARLTGQQGTYWANGTDPDGDQIQYRFDWNASGSHSYSGWMSLVNSGTKLSKNHTWTKAGAYVVKVQSRDEHGATSVWSNGLTVTVTVNHPPNQPKKPTGPTTRLIGQAGTYWANGTDPDGDKIQYRFDWNASGSHSYSGWTSLVNSGQKLSKNHSWTVAGTYVVKVQSRDEHGATSVWSNGLTVTVANHAPNQPKKPTGPTTRLIGQAGTYWANGTDSDGDQIQYRFDWNASGSHSYSGWTSLVNSGTPLSKNHTWTIPGTYVVKVQSRDEHGVTSVWSNGLTVIVSN